MKVSSIEIAEASEPVHALPITPIEVVATASEQGQVMPVAPIEPVETVSGPEQTMPVAPIYATNSTIEEVVMSNEHGDENHETMGQVNLPAEQSPIPGVQKMNIPFLYAVNTVSSQEKIMSRSENLSKALQSFKDISPDVEAAALISDDGLVIASVLPQVLDESRVGGISSALLSLGVRCSSELKRGKVVEVIVPVTGYPS